MVRDGSQNSCRDHILHVLVGFGTNCNQYRKIIHVVSKDQQMKHDFSVQDIIEQLFFHIQSHLQSLPHDNLQ